MRCTRANYEIQLYLDHQLTFSQIRQLEAHIAACGDCYTELNLLEGVTHNLNTLRFVQEPANMHEQIMQRVALNAKRKQQLREKQLAPFSLFFRPSFSEMLVAVLLATVATLSILLQQPSLRAMLPVSNGYGILSTIYIQALHMLTSIDSNTLILGLWIVGTILGVSITLAVAGAEMRTQWFKAVIERHFIR